jgi:hypothetical protein
MQNLIERAIWGNQKRRKHLADPMADVICIVVLAVIFLLAPYMHP